MAENKIIFTGPVGVGKKLPLLLRCQMTHQLRLMPVHLI